MSGAVIVALLGGVLLPGSPVEAGEPVPSLRIEKITSSIGVEAGEDITFEIEVTNVGATTLTGVTVTDAATPDCDMAIGALGVGRTVRYECTHTATVDDVGTFENTATADSNETDPEVSGVAAVGVTAPDGPVPVDYDCVAGPPINAALNASFEVGASDDVDPAEPGDSVDWTFSVDTPEIALPADVRLNWIRLTFPRPDNVDNVALTVNDPPGETANPATGLATTTVDATKVEVQTPNDGRRIYAFADGSLVYPGDADNGVGGTPVVLPELVISGEPTEAARGTTVTWEAPTVIINVQTLGVGEVPCTPATPTPLVTTAVNPLVERLDVDKDSTQAEVAAGDDIDYSFDVENTGNVPLTGLALADGDAPDCDGALPDLAPGESTPVTCSYTTVQGDIGTRWNTATVSANELGSPAASTPVGVLVIDPLTVGLEVPASVVADDPIDVEVDVGNLSTKPVTGVTLAVPNAPACDADFGTLAPSDIDDSACQVDSATLLDDFATGAELDLVATADADEFGPVSSDEAVVDVTLPAPGWTDIQAWYTGAAGWLDYWDLADGYDDNTFRGTNDISRGALARMVHRLGGEAPPFGDFDPSPFPDMPPWAFDAVVWVADDPDDEGERSPLMTGVNGRFEALDPITRGQTIRLLYRFAGEPDTGGFADQHPFPDMPAWLAEAAVWAADDPAGPDEPIIEGIGGLLKPGDPVTRAQVTRMLFRLQDRLDAP